MKASRMVSGVMGILFAFVFIFAAVAWACTPQTVVTQLRPLSGLAGTPLTIAGSTPEQVEIRWGSAEGPVLATASGEDFSVTATVPADAKAGVYYLVSNGRALETFQVTASASETPPQNAQGDLWSGFGSKADGSLSEASASQDARPVSRTAGILLFGLGAGAAALALAAVAVRRRGARAPRRG